MNASDFKAKCLAIIDEVGNTGDRIVISKRGKPVAELVPVAGGARRATLGELWDALTALPVDEGFAEDLATVNASDQPLENPWDSSSTPRR